MLKISKILYLLIFIYLVSCSSTPSPFKDKSNLNKLRKGMSYTETYTELELQEEKDEDGYDETNFKFDFEFKGVKYTCVRIKIFSSGILTHHKNFGYISISKSYDNFYLVYQENKLQDWFFGYELKNGVVNKEDGYYDVLNKSMLFELIKTNQISQEEFDQMSPEDKLMFYKL